MGNKSFFLKRFFFLSHDFQTEFKQIFFILDLSCNKRQTFIYRHYCSTLFFFHFSFLIFGTLLLLLLMLILYIPMSIEASHNIIMLHATMCMFLYDYFIPLHSRWNENNFICAFSNQILKVVVDILSEDDSVSINRVRSVRFY